ncbi:NAD(P)/FAD-dependent oxidoreductase [Methylomonas koyamae]|uniref:FAD-dependent oxidoreductase n=1 Tax=Methylomonas koyamae TaxID=702114 RepID=A0A291IF91_9GAMM|nr:FAD-dependent oxidoreductase [Methylomonas koyamae]ATG88861.1 FAD-dependent oxidoreductase [Methylomonas koyamae]OAI21591.1 FAD-dependent oxidoreductase [Methylomonas koyamae]
MTHHLDILIIGAGISGQLAAREFHNAGRKVAIIDKSGPGLESSWAGGGILLPIYPWRQAPAISELAIQSLKLYPELSAELLERTGIDPEWQPCGMLICKTPDLEAAIDWCGHYKVACQTTIPAELTSALTTRFERPIWLPGIAQARNPRLLKSLSAHLSQLGTQFINDTEIEQIDIVNRRIAGVKTRHGRFAVNELVVSTGAWTSEFLNNLLPDWPVDIDIKPVRGQMLLFDAKPDTLQFMALDGDQYLIPRRDGKILAGSTVEQAGFSKTTTEQARDQLYRFATQLLPTLKDYPVSHHWAGLRPGSPQGIPYIGRHPDLENLYINAGHFRNGLVMGPAAAQLLADLVLQRPTHIDPTPYSPNRTR